MFSDYSIKRLTQRAGAVRLGNDVYDVIRRMIKIYLDGIISHTIINLQWGGHSTVLEKHLLPVLPTALYSEVISSKKCVATDNTKTRLKKSISEVKRLQESSELILAKEPFSDLVTNITKDFRTDTKYSKDAMILLQYSTEYEMIKIIKHAISACVHAGRMTLEAGDLVFSSEVIDVSPRLPVPTSTLPTTNFGVYIKRVLKQVHPNIKISKATQSQINYILNLLARSIVDIAITGAVVFSKTHSIVSRDMQPAIRYLLGGQLAELAVVAGTKAITDYHEDGKCKCVFPPSRAKLFIKGYLDDKNCIEPLMRISDFSAVYLASVLEYIATELLELSGNACVDSGEVVLSNNHLMHTIMHDVELKSLMKKLKVDIIESSIPPSINSRFLPIKK